MEPSKLEAFIAELLHKLGVETESVTVRTGHRTVVAVKTADQHLVGQDGEHLRALNTVAKRMVERSHGEATFLVDVNDHHESELERVRDAARVLATRARLFKHDVEMPPLSSYERLVVHELFQDDPEIATESAGEGKFRHIVLKYKNPTLSKN